MTKIIYTEKQSFFTWWLSLILVLVFAGGAYLGWSNMDPASQQSKAADFWNGAGWGLVITGLIFLLIFGTTLRSRIDSTGLHVRFFPLMFKEKSWNWEDIAEISVRKYSFWEYGGWGYRIGPSGIAYNTKGFYGIQIVLKNNGKRILIGTQKPEEIQSILAELHLIPISEDKIQ